MPQRLRAFDTGHDDAPSSATQLNLEIDYIQSRLKTFYRSVSEDLTEMRIRHRSHYLTLQKELDEHRRTAKRYIENASWDEDDLIPMDYECLDVDLEGEE
jgi:hypothetical protein